MLKKIGDQKYRYPNVTLSAKQNNSKSNSRLVMLVTMVSLSPYIKRIRMSNAGQGDNF
jgi:hypothetical protein